MPARPQPVVRADFGRKHGRWVDTVLTQKDLEVAG